MTGRTDKGGVIWRFTPDLLCIVDETGVLRDTNPAWLTVLGRTAEEMESRPFFDFLHPDDIEATQPAFEAALAGDVILKFENRYLHADGSYSWLSWNAFPDRGSFYCIARDITADKMRQATIKSVEDEARLREEFIAVLSHDLRNPLAAIDSAARILLRDDGHDAKTRDMLEMQQKSVVRMSGLIDDVTDFAQVRLGGGIRMRKNPDFDLQPMLEQTVQEVRIANPEATIIETYEFMEPVECDSARISQLLSNLMSNALTHGRTDRPTRVFARDENRKFVLTVTNEGEPIPQSARPMIFEPFSRGSHSESQNGLGLGLFIARGIAEAHGGTLIMSSDAERTEFTFTMPRTFTA